MVEFRKVLRFGEVVDLNVLTMLMSYAKRGTREFLGSKPFGLARENVFVIPELERKGMKSYIELSEELAANIVDVVREPMLVLDADCKLMAANIPFYKTFQVTPEQTLGHQLFTLWDGQWDITSLRQHLENLLSKHIGFDELEVRCAFATIGLRILLVSGRYLHQTSQGEKILLTIADVTEQRLAADELQKLNDQLQETVSGLEVSNHELEQFAYVASHDLQEPLRMVASYTELLARRYEGQLDDKADKYIGYVVEGAKRMQLLINDLLTLSRLTTRRQPPSPVDTYQIVTKVLKSLETLIAESGAQIDVGELPVVLADRSQIIQVFQNLITNAIKFHSDVPPKITIDAEQEGRFWRFVVADNGIGIAPEHHNRIFAIFQRLHKRSEFEGSGMGLAIVKKTVERHGGQIVVESAPGQGSRFLFTLPATDN